MGHVVVQRVTQDTQLCEYLTHVTHRPRESVDEPSDVRSHLLRRYEALTDVVQATPDRTHDLLRVVSVRLQRIGDGTPHLLLLLRPKVCLIGTVHDALDPGVHQLTGPLDPEPLLHLHHRTLDRVHRGGGQVAPDHALDVPVARPLLRERIPLVPDVLAPALIEPPGERDNTLLRFLPTGDSLLRPGVGRPLPEQGTADLTTGTPGRTSGDGTQRRLNETVGRDERDADLDATLEGGMRELRLLPHTQRFRRPISCEDSGERSVDDIIRS